MCRCAPRFVPRGVARAGARGAPRWLGASGVSGVGARGGAERAAPAQGEQCVDRAVERSARNGAEEEPGAAVLADRDDVADAGVVQRRAESAAARQGGPGRSLAAHALGGLAARQPAGTDAVREPDSAPGVQ